VKRVFHFCFLSSTHLGFHPDALATVNNSELNTLQRSIGAKAASEASNYTVSHSLSQSADFQPGELSG
jgi:hypothetical protein